MGRTVLKRNQVETNVGKLYNNLQNALDAHEWITAEYHVAFLQRNPRSSEDIAESHVDAFKRGYLTACMSMFYLSGDARQGLIQDMMVQEDTKRIYKQTRAELEKHRKGRQIDDDRAELYKEIKNALRKNLKLPQSRRKPVSEVFRSVSKEALQDRRFSAIKADGGLDPHKLRKAYDAFVRRSSDKGQK